MRSQLALAFAAVLVLPGCFYGPAWGVGSSGSTDDAEARSNVRASIPVIEAYYADNGTYAGATVERLSETYDHGLPDVSLVVSSDGETYCVESTVGSVSYSKRGPAGDVVRGACGPPGPARVPAPAHTDAEAAVLEAIPYVEAYYADTRTYTGASAEKLVQRYGFPLGEAVRVAWAGKRGYCVEAPAQAPSAHYVGPRGPVAPGSCPKP